MSRRKCNLFLKIAVRQGALSEKDGRRLLAVLRKKDRTDAGHVAERLGLIDRPTRHRIERRVERILVASAETASLVPVSRRGGRLSRSSHELPVYETPEPQSAPPRPPRQRRSPRPNLLLPILAVLVLIVGLLAVPALASRGGEQPRDQRVASELDTTLRTVATLEAAQREREAMATLDGWIEQNEPDSRARAARARLLQHCHQVVDQETKIVRRLIAEDRLDMAAHRVQDLRRRLPNELQTQVDRLGAELAPRPPNT